MAGEDWVAGEGRVTLGGPASGSDPLEERVIESELVRRGRIFEYRVDTIERADGSLAIRDTVRHPGAVAVLALDDAGQLLLVRQWRVAAGRALLEVPAGTLDVHDGVAEDPAEAARRELEEETGHRASTWRHLATFWTAPGFATELMHLYLATGLEGAGDGDDRLAPDEDERLELRRVPLDEALAMVERGELADAKSLVGILLLDRLRREGRLAGVPDLHTGAPERPGVPVADPEAVNVTFGYTPLEFALANAAFMRHQRSSQVVGWMSVAVTALNLATFQDPFLAVGTGLLGLAFLTGLFVVPFIWWSFRRKAAALGAIELTIDGTGVTSGAVFGAGTVVWEGIEKIERGGRWYFVRGASGMAFPIPERVLAPNDLARFGRHALRHGLTLDGHRVEPAVR
jgi:ADP-ribose pyrophosphatase